MLDNDDWPPTRPSLKRRISLKASNFLLKFGHFLSRRDSEWFKRLQYQAESGGLHEPNSSLPEGSSIELDHILYGDLYAVESFPRLKQGMDILFREHEAKLPIYQSDRWYKWVNQRKKRAVSVGATNVGHLDLSDTCTFFRSCQVNAFGMGGYVSLGLRFTPSKECRDEFKKLLDEGGEATKIVTMPNLFKPLSDLSLLRWVRYSLGFTWEPKSSDLQRRVDQLFLRCNREAADLLESYFKGGLSSGGPLPSLEIISTDIPRNQLLSLEEEKKRANPPDHLLRNQFWTHVGQSFPPVNPWRWEWGQLYQSRRSDKYQFRSYQIVVHQPDLTRLENYRIDNREPREDEDYYELALRAYLRDRTVQIGALLAIRETIFRLRDRLVNLRNLLSPELRTRGGRVFLKVVAKGPKVLSEINAVQFSQERLWSEVKKDSVRRFLFRSLLGARRSQRNSKEAVDFVDDWSEQVENVRKENQDRLERVEVAYEKLFSIINARATFFLQLTVAALTVALLWLTILMVVNGL